MSIFAHTTDKLRLTAISIVLSIMAGILAFLAGGCGGVQPTAEQVSLAREHDIALGTGYSVGVYQANFDRVFKDAIQVVEQHDWRTTGPERELVWIVDRDRSKPVRVIQRKDLPETLPSEEIAVHYLGQWECTKVLEVKNGRETVSRSVYHVSVEALPIDVVLRSYSSGRTKVTVECLRHDLAIIGDYDQFVRIHRDLQMKLGVKYVPVPKKNEIERIDVNVKTTDDTPTALMVASQEGQTEVVKTLLENGADVNVKRTTDGATALILAAWKGHTEIVKLLLGKGAEVNAADKTGTTALWIAAQEGHTEVVKCLLEKGADINAKATNGVTALWMAAQNGHVDVVKLLLEKGADVNLKRNTDGVTALWQASQNGHTEVVKCLLEKGADVNAKVANGMTALWMAAKNGHAEIVKCLLVAKADVNAANKTNGVTPVFIASMNGRTEVVKLLLEKGADVNAKANDGKTALAIAKENGRTDIVQLLEKAGAKE